MSPKRGTQHLRKRRPRRDEVEIQFVVLGECNDATCIFCGARSSEFEYTAADAVERRLRDAPAPRRH